MLKKIFYLNIFVLKLFLLQLTVWTRTARGTATAWRAAACAARAGRATAAAPRRTRSGAVCPTAADTAPGTWTPAAACATPGSAARTALQVSTYHTVQYSTVQHSIIQYSTVQYNIPLIIKQFPALNINTPHSRAVRQEVWRARPLRGRRVRVRGGLGRGHVLRGHVRRAVRAARHVQQRHVSLHQRMERAPLHPGGLPRQLQWTRYGSLFGTISRQFSHYWDKAPNCLLLTRVTCPPAGTCSMPNYAPPGSWECLCESGWYGPGCDIRLEQNCDDKQDNDKGKLRIFFSLYKYFSFADYQINCS